MSKIKRVVGYTRVSTIKQSEEGESLKTQEAAIKRYCNAYKNLELIEIYSDAGISGGSTSNRPALLRLLRDRQYIDLVLVNDLSRLGRNTRELLNNVDELRKAGVEIHFLEERMDINTDSGNLTFQILSAVAEFIRKTTARASHSNKVARCESGVPATGKIPWGRIYDKDNDIWILDEEKKGIFVSAIEEFIKGGSLREIGSKIPKKYNLTYSNLYKVLKTAAGPTWQVKLKEKTIGSDEASKFHVITFNVPPLLDTEMLKLAHEKLAFNKTSPRLDTEKKELYLLRGYLRCWACGKSLYGQRQKNRKYKNDYYNHPLGREKNCKTIPFVPLEKIENAILRVIWENTMDEDAFNEAMQSKFPSPERKFDLSELVLRKENDLSRIKRDKNKLVDALLKGTLTEDTIKSKELELIKEEQLATNQLESAKKSLAEIETDQEVEKRLREVRSELLDYFSSWDYFDRMTFKDKRRLIHSTFGHGGLSEDNIPYGVYIRRIGKGKYEYRIVAVLFEGEQILYKDNYDYYDSNDPEIPDMLDRSDFLVNKASGLYTKPERPE